jgi:hypothetical protein
MKPAPTSRQLPSARGGVLVLTLWVCQAVPVQAAMYQWVDETGVTVYSQTPPPRGDAREIRPPPPPAESPQAIEQNLRDQLQRLNDAREDREVAAQARRQEQERQELDRRNCSAARANLASLERLGGGLLHLPDGSYVRLTEEQRQARMAGARQQIGQHCPGGSQGAAAEN